MAQTQGAEEKTASYWALSRIWYKETQLVVVLVGFCNESHLGWYAPSSSPFWAFMNEDKGK